MKVTKMTRTRCECDFCGKKNWSVGHMKRHEERCTKNPDRTCGVCKMIAAKQQPMEKLLELLPVPAIKEGKYEDFVLVSPTTEELNNCLPALRKACDDCPACMMSAIRQKGYFVSWATGFSWEKEMANIWGYINDSHDYGR